MRATIDEALPLCEKKDGSTVDTRNMLKLCVATVLVFVTLLFFSSSPKSVSVSSRFHPDVFSKAAANLPTKNAVKLADAVKVRSINPGYGDLQSLDLLPWDAVLEPHKAQGLELSQFVLNGEEVDTVSSSAYTVSWSIDKKLYYGNQIYFTPTKVGVMDCTVTITKTESSQKPTNKFLTGPKTVTTHSFKLAVKYIRREIRSMSDSDRTKLFNAMHVLYTVDGATGREVYGEKYVSAEEFLYIHLNGAGTSDCDHWHDGAGILTHHVAITLQFEQSLQVIDPSISLPYWEYTMDGYKYDEWTSSPMFRPDWFGEASPSNEDHKINDGGPWDSMKVPDGSAYKDWDIATTKSLNPFVNAYGAMRSPWNNNPTEYLGRFNLTYGKAMTSFPTCIVLKYTFRLTSLSDMNYFINGATHGPVHILIGGAWAGGDVSEYVKLQSSGKLLLFKVLWRKGYTRCPVTCTRDSACKCSVPDEYIAKYGVRKMLTDINAVYSFSDELDDASDEELLAFLRDIEDPGIAGEMFTSGASYDPSFWPLHGSAERLVAYKRALISNGNPDVGEFDETWGYPVYEKTEKAVALEGVCDWSSVQGVEDLTLPVCDTSATCSGHNEDDIMEFRNFQNKGESYTNAEMYAFIHPWNDDLPYVYDTLEYDYCTEAGYPFLSQDTITTAGTNTISSTESINDAAKSVPAGMSRQ